MAARIRRQRLWRLTCPACGATGHIWQELESSDPFDRWPDVLGAKKCMNCLAEASRAVMAALVKDRR